MLTSDRPEHTRLRRLVTADFTRDAMERQRPAIERLAAESVDQMLADGETDAVARLASPLPVAVIAQLLGVPEADFPDFREWSDKIVKAFALGRGLRAIRDSADVLGSTIKLNHYMAEQFERLRREPGRRRAEQPDRLVRRGAADARTSCSGSPSCCSWRATRPPPACSARWRSSFARHPDQYARVREEPELVPSAVEESLRHGSPIQGLYRTASADHSGRRRVHPGRRPRAAALRRRQPRPSPVRGPGHLRRRRATRRTTWPSARGIHFCLGAHLARLEGQVVLSELIRRVERDRARRRAANGTRTPRCAGWRACRCVWCPA